MTGQNRSPFHARHRLRRLTTGCLIATLALPSSLSLTAAGTPAFAVIATNFVEGGWYSSGGVTDPTQYVDYSSAVVSSEYRADIEAATRLGLVVGHDDRTFRPEDLVTVGQFANIIARNFSTQGQSEVDNLAYLRSLGLDAANPSAALSIAQVQQAAAALQGHQGVANLAILASAHDGTLSGSGVGGGITRGQAVDLLLPVNTGGGSSANDPPPPTEPTGRARVRGAITPNPAQQGQMILLTATTRDLVSVSVELPWGTLTMIRTGERAFAVESVVPAGFPLGDHQANFVGTAPNGATRHENVTLTVIAGATDTGVEFVITD